MNMICQCTKKIKNVHFHSSWFHLRGKRQKKHGNSQAWLLTLVDRLEHCPSFLGYIFFLGMFKQAMQFINISLIFLCFSLGSPHFERRNRWIKKTGGRAGLIPWQISVETASTATGQSNRWENRWPGASKSICNGLDGYSPFGDRDIGWVRSRVVFKKRGEDFDKTGRWFLSRDLIWITMFWDI